MQYMGLFGHYSIGGNMEFLPRLLRNLKNPNDPIVPVFHISACLQPFSTRKLINEPKYLKLIRLI
jgi:hypothetical protein